MGIRGGIPIKYVFPRDPRTGEVDTGGLVEPRLYGPCPSRRCGERHDRREDRLARPCRAAVEQGRRELTLGVDL